MAKSAQAFRTIREVADWLDVAAHVLRFWESKFSQIRPVKRAGGRRYYRPADMQLVGGIKVLLHDRGMTIRGVQKMIADDGVEAVCALSPPIDDLLDNPNVVQLGAEDAWDADLESEAADLFADRNLSSDIAPDAAVQMAPEIASPVEGGAAGNRDTAPEPMPEPELLAEPEPEATIAPVPSPEPPLAAEPDLVAILGTSRSAPPDLPAAVPDTPPQAPPVAADMRDTPLPGQAAASETLPASPSVPDTAALDAPALPPVFDGVQSAPRLMDSLDTLARFARLPAEKRAHLRPQIVALARLHDTMTSPRTGV